MGNEKETWIQIPRTSKFANIGVELEGEINFFKLVFIDDLYEMGLIVIDPDGNQVAINTVENEEIVETRFSFERKEFLLQLYLTNDVAYEIILSERMV